MFEKNPYGYQYRKKRAELLYGGPLCHYCKERIATTADHVPPLSKYADRSQWEGILVPACGKCNFAMGARITNQRRKKQRGSRKW